MFFQAQRVKAVLCALYYFTFRYLFQYFGSLRASILLFSPDGLPHGPVLSEAHQGKCTYV